MHYDAIFISGDMNFRINGMSREEIIDRLRRNDLVPLLEKDELNHLFYRKDKLPQFIADYHEAAGVTFRSFSYPRALNCTIRIHGCLIQVIYIVSNLIQADLQV